MIQRSDCADLTLEAVTELLRGNLDGDIAADARIARAIDFAHSARADRGDDGGQVWFLWCVSFLFGVDHTLNKAFYIDFISV